MILQSISNYISLGGLGAIFIAIGLLLEIIALHNINNPTWRSLNAHDLFMMTGFFFLLIGGLLIGLHFS